MVDEMIRAINARSEAEGQAWKRHESILRQARIDQKQLRKDRWRELALNAFCAIFAYLALVMLFII